MKKIRGQVLTGERALFSSVGLDIYGCEFRDGESPLKESVAIRLEWCVFDWKYPLWYCMDVEGKSLTLNENARSGIWYTHGITLTDTLINAPKTFRRSSGISLKDVRMPNALETMWSCCDISLDGVYVKGDYFGMNCDNVKAQGLRIDGNYAFDGASDVEIRDSVLNSKDAFWNCRNVTVYDSVVIGEYLGWNSENVTFVNCTLESNQGMCYMENLKLVNCTVRNTDLAFEYSTVDADICSVVDSVKNPEGGRIIADGYGEIIHESDRVDVTQCEIITREKK